MFKCFLFFPPRPPTVRIVLDLLFFSLLPYLHFFLTSFAQNFDFAMSYCVLRVKWFQLNRSSVCSWLFCFCLKKKISQDYLEFLARHNMFSSVKFLKISSGHNKQDILHFLFSSPKIVIFN